MIARMTAQVRMSSTKMKKTNWDRRMVRKINLFHHQYWEIDEGDLLRFGES
jgi:hypothetical protein